ncbi:MAG: L-fucose/L-arabinose isomerase family protein [Clostridia bacterium]|nr:L-fucose/L-arabinose isomerase family protein [Clostridia bacterium]
MKNIPEIKLGIIAVSRDCFPVTLSEKRRANIVGAYKGDIYECPVTVENESDMLKAVDDVKKIGCNALVVFLGNFGPETPETLIAKYFDGPCMFVAAAEGDGDLINGRGDAYCGMLNCSYNLGMRKLNAYIPAYPVGTADDIAKMIADFVPVARAVIGVKNLKIITFGPRPQDFFACNAPIKGLYELGVEVEENSELDLLVSYREHAGDARIQSVCDDMASELGVTGNNYPSLLPRMAQFELTLLDWAENHKGARKYIAFADKCWPAFPKEFGFEPCYVNSRLASRGIPVSCEVDIYGALSEYIGACISGDAVTLLDINNSVPAPMWEESIKGKYGYALTDTFMGFHCGNTPSCKMCSDRAVKYQLIQNRLLENGGEPDFTRGTLEGDIAAGDITFYRLQCDSEGTLRAYIAEGEVLPVRTTSFGGIGVFAIPEMGRFYRHVLIEKRFPHHGAVAFGHYGKALFEVMKFLGISDISYNQPKGLPYKTENPWG